jgi:hypothetical protein
MLCRGGGQAKYAPNDILFDLACTGTDAPGKYGDGYCRPAGSGDLGNDCPPPETPGPYLAGGRTGTSGIRYSRSAQRGADAVIHPEFAVGTEMIRQGLDRPGFPDAEVDSYIEMVRQHRYRQEEEEPLEVS